jgi:hypothetical protein
MMEITILALLLLQLKHFVCDFITQTPYQLRHKGIYGHPGGLLHAAHHVVGSAVVLVLLKIVMLLPIPPTLIATVLSAEFLIHYHIDWGKEQIVKPFVETQGPAYWAVFGFDQFLHQTTYVAMVYVILRA